MVKTTIINLTERKARLLIEDSAPYFVNSLRRVLTSETPKLAVHHVVVYDNNSGLFDEIVAHRLGLLPVPTDPNAFTTREECTCEGQGCPNCTVRFTLSKEGPCTVYAEDLQPEDPKFAIAEPKVPIVELLQGQRLILEAEAVLGMGTQHAKWQPVSGCGYSYLLRPKGPKAVETLKAVAKECEVDKGRVTRGKTDVQGPGGHIELCDACVLRAEEDGAELVYDDSKFVFRFETDGSLSAQQALMTAASLLAERVDEIEDQSGKIKAVQAKT